MSACPKYEVLKKFGDFEIRRYPAYSWVVAREPGLNMPQAGKSNFWKLFGYIGGHNEEKRKIPMTVPVMNSLVHEDEDTFIKDFNMMFWLNEEHQDSPPKPVKEDDPAKQVEVVKYGERVAYVRGYSWWAKETLIKENEQKLKESLDAAGYVAGEDYDDSVLYSAQYNSPWTIFGRHNEVMFMKPVSQSVSKSVDQSVCQSISLDEDVQQA